MQRSIAFTTSLAVLALGLTACQPTDPARKLARQYQVPERECRMQEDWDTPLLWIYPQSVKRGQEIVFDPYIRAGPGGRNGKAGCLRNITVTPEGPYPTWREDGRLLFTVPVDAPSGQSYTVTARYGGKDIRAEMRVFRPDEQPLVGTWQQEVGCTGREPMRELIFEAGGGFRATYTPFESYYDFWGSYSFDVATSTLTLDITGGNRVPDSAKDGTIIIEGDSFRLGTASLGAGDGSICTSPFYRRTPPG